VQCKRCASVRARVLCCASSKRDKTEQRRNKKDTTQHQLNPQLSLNVNAIQLQHNAIHHAVVRVSCVVFAHVRMSVSCGINRPAAGGMVDMVADTGEDWVSGMSQPTV